ncbi:hypothetical protein [Sphingosinicella sp. CPCC 101087]|uniref:hypothetical protein n=1 Tax=Sphingosinicella sp. CPCC 101087 TaxID=2497754 RepID=UPI00101E19D2|nr:hypothetical protein [Sphingosinicella sp. CPCC 101087]
MIVRGFRPVAWVAAVGAAALGCYMLSLQVAAERAELASLEREIVETRQDIRSLQTELGTRARLQQLEHWNAEVLALSAPVAGQFLESNVSLARFDVRQRTFGDEQVRLAAAESAPAAPAPVGQAPVRLASAEVHSAPAVAAAGPVHRPLVRRASLTILPVADEAPTARSTPASATSAPPRRSALLDESTLRDLGAQSRSERGGGTRN